MYWYNKDRTVEDKSPLTKRKKREERLYRKAIVRGEIADEVASWTVVRGPRVSVIGHIGITLSNRFGVLSNEDSDIEDEAAVMYGRKGRRKRVVKINGFNVEPEWMTLCVGLTIPVQYIHPRASYEKKTRVVMARMEVQTEEWPSLSPGVSYPEQQGILWSAVVVANLCPLLLGLCGDVEENPGPDMVTVITNMETPKTDLVLRWETRVANLSDSGHAAANMYNNIQHERHDAFGRSICDLLNIEFRSDVPIINILDMLNEKYDLTYENTTWKITPDNYMMRGNDLYIIDYKVSRSTNTMDRTLEKYVTIFNRMMADYSALGAALNIKVVLYTLDPHSWTVWVSDLTLSNDLGINDLDIDEVTHFNALLTYLNNTYSENDDYLSAISEGDIKMTPSWFEHNFESDCLEDPTFISFRESLSPLELADFDKYWKTSTMTMAEYVNNFDSTVYETQPEVSKFIKESCRRFREKDITSCCSPTVSEIKEGWTKLEAKMKDMYDLSPSPTDCKPSVHCLWSPNLKGCTEVTASSNFKKMLHFGDMLNRVDWGKALLYDGKGPQDTFIPFLRNLAYDMKCQPDENAYNRMVAKLKNSTDKKSIRIPSNPPSNAKFLHDMQIEMQNFNGRRAFLNQCGVDVAKDGDFRHGRSTLQDNRPKMLDPYSKELKHHVIHEFQKSKELLGEEVSMHQTKTHLDFYLEKIRACSELSGVGPIIDSVMKTSSWKYLVDISQLIRGALAVSLHSNYRSYRLIYCASNSTFLVLLPSNSLRMAGSTLAFFTITFHRNRLIHTGIDRLSAPIGDSDINITVSNCVRLDKERAKRLVESPYLFLMLIGNMYNPAYLECDSGAQDLILFCFYSAINITKSLMSLTEPSRYIMMGSSSLASDIKGYIGDKFKPRTKTFFSLYVMYKYMKASIVANQVIKEVVLNPTVMAEDDVKSRGITNTQYIPSIFFQGLVSIKEYLTEVFLPFYINSKGLHYYHHNIVSLAKVPCEIELGVKQNVKDFWSYSEDQYVNLSIFRHYIAKYYRKQLPSMTRLRFNVEKRGKFQDQIFTISTMTSSKSCLQVGDCSAFKGPSRNVNKKGNKIFHQPRGTSKMVWQQSNTRLYRDQILTVSVPQGPFFWQNSMFSANKDTESISTYIANSRLHVGKRVGSIIPLQLNNNNPATAIIYKANIQQIAGLEDVTYCLHQLRDHLRTLDLRIVYVNIPTELSFDDFIGCLFAVFKEDPYCFHIVSKKIESPNSILTPSTIDHQRALFAHHSYNSIKQLIPEYVDHMTTKVYDALYKNADEYSGKPFTKIAEEILQRKKLIYATMFDKKQRTDVDREIYEMEADTKVLLYSLEQVFKQLSNIDSREMISMAGDMKINRIEQTRNDLFSFVLKHRKSGGAGSEIPHWKTEVAEVNADMSKWSAKDVTMKYYWMIVMCPILHPYEKSYYIKFLSLYQRKRLILPDNVMAKLLDQMCVRPDDPFRMATEHFGRNWIEVTQNWFQGNLNYISSTCHSIAMGLMQDVYSSIAYETGGTYFFSSLVHSDDNQTSVALAVPRDQDVGILALHAFDTLQRVMQQFGFKLNSRKTYVSHVIKEFVSILNLNGEPFSIFSRFLFPVVGACAFIGPYEDLSARLSGVQCAIRHGCPPSLAWLAIAVAVEMTYSTYSMLPGQVNNIDLFGIPPQRLPLELGGIPDFDLGGFTILGSEAHDIKILTNILHQCGSFLISNEQIEDLVDTSFDIARLSPQQRWIMSFYTVFTLNDTFDPEETFGETYEMRSKSIVVPRKFTTHKLIRKLQSNIDFRALTTEEQITLLEHINSHQELLVTKAVTAVDYKSAILYRYYSRRFQESLSIQSATQLFIEQVMNANRKCIDRNFTHAYLPNCESEEDQAQLIGKITFTDAWTRIKLLVDAHTITGDELHQLLKTRIMSDTLTITVANMTDIRIGGSRELVRQKFSVKSLELQTIRNTMNSPFDVIRAYVGYMRDDTLPDPSTTLYSDVIAAAAYMQGSGLLTFARDRHVAEGLSDLDKLKAKLSAWTTVLQSLYIYLSQVGRRANSILLPKRTHSTLDYVLTIYGSLRSDGVVFNILKQNNPVRVVVKGQTTVNKVRESSISKRLFRSLCHFSELYINPSHRKLFLSEVIEHCTYNDITVKHFYDVLLSTGRREYLALLNLLGDLKDDDLNHLRTSRYVKASWLKEQQYRRSNIGEYAVIYWNSLGSMRVYGDGNKVTTVQFLLTDVTNTGQMRFYVDAFTKDMPSIGELIPSQFVEKSEYHLVRKMNRYNRWVFEVMLTDRIGPEVIVHAVTIGRGRAQISQPSELLEHNRDNLSARYFGLEGGRSISTRRGALGILRSVLGEIPYEGSINIMNLMRNIEYLQTSYGSINYSVLASLHYCDGSVDEFLDPVEMSLTMDDAELEELPIESNLATALYSIRRSARTFKDSVLDQLRAIGDNRAVVFKVKSVVGRAEQGMTTRLMRYLLTLRHCYMILRSELNVEASDSFISFDRLLHMCTVGTRFHLTDRLSYHGMPPSYLISTNMGEDADIPSIRERINNPYPIEGDGAFHMESTRLEAKIMIERLATRRNLQMPVGLPDMYGDSDDDLDA